jgi:hypothetical protein
VKDPVGPKCLRSSPSQGPGGFRGTARCVRQGNRLGASCQDSAFSASSKPAAERGSATWWRKAGGTERGCREKAAFVRMVGFGPPKEQGAPLLFGQDSRLYPSLERGWVKTGWWYT